MTAAGEAVQISVCQKYPPMPFHVLAQPIYTVYVRVRFFSADMPRSWTEWRNRKWRDVSHGSKSIFHQSGHSPRAPNKFNTVFKIISVKVPIAAN